jgi:hypothetical protein
MGGNLSVTPILVGVTNRSAGKHRSIQQLSLACGAARYVGDHPFM